LEHNVSAIVASDTKRVYPCWGMQNTTDSQTPGSPDSALQILLAKLEEAKARNPRLSLRAYAQKIGISSGALSEILNGKRPLTNAIRRKLAPKLLLSPQESLQFFREDLPEELSATADDRATLNHDQFHLISDWWYFGLLSLMQTRGFKSTTNWMARRLGLKEHIVNEAWERLLRLGYLKKVGARVVQGQGYFKTQDGLMDISIRRSHLEDLKLIENSLLDVPIDLRDNTSCTFVIDKKDLPKAKEMIRIFQAQFLKQVSHDVGDEVYKLSVSLYPLTKVQRDN
jgi:uncharacterized protein (TIGR02147 family)